jgi:GNAT superfamily N-acetyltransferase
MSDAENSPRALADGVEIRPGRPDDADALLPLMRGYCDFYEVDPPDSGLLELARTIAGDPEQGGRDQGSLFVAEEGGEPIGFAVMDWKWASTAGARVGHLEDLFVSEAARGKGVADALIRRCAERCRELGIATLGWMTAPDNHRAQKVYDRSGANRSEWLEYELDTLPGGQAER